MNKETALRKLEALLNMAKDSSSPNEAAIAAGQARKLMDKFNLTEDSVKDTKSKKYGTMPVDIFTGKKIPKTFWYLAWKVAKLNDCLPWTRIVNGRKVVTFNGEHADTISAKLIYTYLVEECKKQADLAFANDTSGTHGKTFKHSFYYGFFEAIAEKVASELNERRKAVDTSTGTALIVVKNQIVKDKFPELRYSGESTTAVNSNRGRAAGYTAGQNTGLNRQVTSSTKRLR